MITLNFIISQVLTDDMYFAVIYKGEEKTILNFVDDECGHVLAFDKATNLLKLVKEVLSLSENKTKSIFKIENQTYYLTFNYDRNDEKHKLTIAVAEGKIVFKGANYFKLISFFVRFKRAMEG